MICPLTSEHELIVSLLSTMDDLERGIDSMESSYMHGNSGLLSHIQGLMMIKARLQNILGVEPLCALYRPFSTKTMEAVGRESRADLPVGTVSQVIQTGYKKDGMVLRYAKVIVSH